MRIEQLQAFLSVAETGSFQAAAQQCAVTQSTVSRQVQALEAELDAPLFHRGAQAKLTVAGERLLPKARRIYQDWMQVSKDIADLMAGKQPELCVAAIQSVCATVLPPVLQQFCSEYPQVQLRVTALGSDRSLKVLRDGLVDLAIVMDNPRLTTQPEMVVTPLFEESIEVLMAGNHDLARQPAISWEMLARFPQIIFKDGYGMARLVQQQFQDRGEVFNPAMELNTLDAFRGVIRQGNFVALLPQSALSDCHDDPTLAVRPTEAPVLTRSVVLVTTRDRLVIPPIQRFHDLVQSLATPIRSRPAAVSYS
ncbi:MULTISPECIES: LysR family transcriptional regulator [Cyanophyceae]|uniref:LysR family transcriptional regulator n=1 Tax=Cyanophyceae TaxID=3028117 RepID=UPI0016828C78|nr:MULTISPECIES: LysR family transcriptional regulator [Cyanophyceae]MBD1914976.1 LysR family transcriptional regulator [Phormidium sp. FACHB-77]MBD2032763.1 LysR family transcriptional regulator [Phormidium sp. FACHB-322]MBD2049908.1 LysR family transcriptional regulator [Leptolyngbya sp. FACHB-60]